MATLSEKFQRLLATTSPTKREPDGGRFYHEAVCFTLGGVVVQFTVVDGKEAPSLSDMDAAFLADLMFVIDDKGNTVRPERPDTDIDCPKGHGKMKRVAALNINVKLQLPDARLVYAAFPIIDVPTCLHCGAAAFDDEVQKEMASRAETVMNPTETMTMFCIFNNPKERPGTVSVAKRVIGKAIDVLDPKDVTYFPDLRSARASLPAGTTPAPHGPNELQNLVEAHMIPTAEISVPVAHLN